MGLLDTGEATANETFLRVLPFLILPTIIVVVFLDGRAAVYAGVAFGIGVILLGTGLAYREARQREESNG